MAAEKIQAEFPEGQITLFNIKENPLSKISEFDVVILGISTWDYGELQEDWESHWQETESIDFSDKIVALYGMGDQLGYTDWFQDALGMLHDVVLSQGGFVIGHWPNEGYEFAASKALTEDKSAFVGLALDEDNQYMLSEERVTKWCQQLQSELTEIFA